VQSDRVTLYKKVELIEKQVEEKIVASLHFEKMKESETDRELECLRKIQRAEVTVTSLKSAFQQMTSLLFEFKNQIDHKTSHVSELER
jgi:hypothetical protein